ncbi:MAG: 50S ribosomal protein L21 [Candidatus Omnitrophota bacterium]
MLAIVQVGSSQYKVSEGDLIDTQILDEKEGKAVTIDKVLLFQDGDTVKIGQPFLSDVKVTAKVSRHHLADKVVSFKYSRREGWEWKKGHRQKLTRLQITKISSGK